MDDSTHELNSLIWIFGGGLLCFALLFAAYPAYRCYFMRRMRCQCRMLAPDEAIGRTSQKAGIVVKIEPWVWEWWFVEGTAAEQLTTYHRTKDCHDQLATDSDVADGLEPIQSGTLFSERDAAELVERCGKVIYPVTRQIKEIADKIVLQPHNELVS